jgi:hypothetical protein
VDNAWADCGWICFLFTTFLRSLDFYYGLLLNHARPLTWYVEALKRRDWCVDRLLGWKVVNRRRHPEATIRFGMIRQIHPDRLWSALCRRAVLREREATDWTAEYARATAAIERERLSGHSIFAMPLAATTTAIRLPARKFVAALARWRHPAVIRQPGSGRQKVSALCVFGRNRQESGARPRDRCFPSVASLCLTGCGR